MIHNDVLRSVRFLLDVNDVGIANLFSLGGLEVPLADVGAYLRKEGEPGFAECPDRAMGAFLDGLVVDRRGRREGEPLRPTEGRVTNNVVLKKLRVAFELRDEDIVAALAADEVRISKGELSALFRQPGHSNYRACGDQFLRNVLAGLGKTRRR